MSAFLLLLALAPLWQVIAGRRQPPSPGPRFPRILRAHLVRFGLPPVLLLGLTGQWSAFWQLPLAFAPAARWLRLEGLAQAERWLMVEAAAIGIAFGVCGGVLLTAWRAWRGRPEGTLFGDAGTVRPRDPSELGWAGAVAVTAGVTEEAYFRLLLPLLAAQAGVPPTGAFAGAAMLFGLAHRYQGWRGVMATTFAGVALTLAYLASGSLFAVMAFHAIGDLGHLVLRPMIRRWIEQRR